MLEEERQQVVQRDKGDAGSEVGEPVRQDELVVVDHGAAGIEDVGHIALTLAIVGA